MRAAYATKLVAAGALAWAASAGAQVTVGVTNDSNCIPSGCALGFDHYQQVYASSVFAAPMLIGAVTIFQSFDPSPFAEFARGTYQVSLGTTTKAVNGLSSSFAANATSPLSFYATLVIAAGTSAAAPTFTIVGVPFFYDPALGNLLLDVQYSNSAGDFGVFFDSDRSGTFTSRAIGTGDAASADPTGIVTRFDGSPVSATPEPASVVLVATGLFGIGAVARRRKRTNAMG